MKIREPVVSGQFYSANASKLKAQISELFDKNSSKQDAKGIILPHAGYIYSAQVACSVLSRINNYSTYVILGPNHTGYGSRLSISDADAWKTPLGLININKGIAAKIVENSCFEFDTLAHKSEHSIEVELPLLQFINNAGFDFVPISVGTSDLELLKSAASVIAKAISKLDSVLLVASSDMTHYETQKSAKEKDSIALRAILDLNENLLIESVKKHKISMCGFAPVIMMLAATKELGAKKAQMVQYQTSAERSGDYSAVVGYAGVLVN